MDRLALIGIFFFSGLLAIAGSMTMATLVARKGYQPRWGVLGGALTGVLGGILPALAVLYLAENGGLAVLTALVAGTGITALVGRLIPDRDPQRDALPSGAAFRRNILARHAHGRIAQALFALSIVLALLALATLLWRILNRAGRAHPGQLRSAGSRASRYRCGSDSGAAAGERTPRPPARAGLATYRRSQTQVLAHPVGAARARGLACG